MTPDPNLSPRFHQLALDWGGAAIASPILRPCVRCTMIAKVDHAGYCPLCQYEFAEGRVYINWGALTTGQPCQISRIDRPLLEEIPA